MLLFFQILEIKYSGREGQASLVRVVIAEVENLSWFLVIHSEFFHFLCGSLEIWTLVCRSNWREVTGSFEYSALRSAALNTEFSKLQSWLWSRQIWFCFPSSLLFTFIEMHFLQEVPLVFFNVHDAWDILDVVHCYSLCNADIGQ